jgi:hypothetical protein
VTVEERFFRIGAVVQMVVVAGGADVAPPVPRTPERPHSERARYAWNRGRSHYDFEEREVIGSIVEAVSAIDQEIRRLRHHIALVEGGAALRPELCRIGGDGVALSRHLSWGEGDAVFVVLSLFARDSEHLLCLPAVIHQDPDGTEMIFSDLFAEERDLVVAFVLQQQARERRRDLDSTGGA